MSLRELIIGVMAVGALALGVISVFRPAVTPPLGATPGSDFYSTCETHNGVMTCTEGKKLTVATSTPCAIKSPSATSTLVRSTLNIITSSSTATTWTLATSTTAFATTSALTNAFSLGSGALGAMGFYGTSTAINAGIVNSPDIVPPNTWVVWGAKGFLPADTTKLNGSCDAVFQVI